MSVLRRDIWALGIQDARVDRRPILLILTFLRFVGLAAQVLATIEATALLALMLTLADGLAITLTLRVLSDVLGAFLTI